MRTFIAKLLVVVSALLCIAIALQPMCVLAESASSGITTVQGERMKSAIDPYLKFKNQVPATYEEYFSKIENVKVKWLLPRQLNDYYVNLKWLPLKTDIIAMTGIVNYVISIKDLQTGKYLILNRLISISKPCEILYKFPAFGKYLLTIKAKNMSLYSKETQYEYTLGKYCVPLSESIKKPLYDKFDKQCEEYLNLGESPEKIAARQAEWIKLDKNVKGASYGQDSVLVKFIDNTSILLKVKTWYDAKSNEPENGSQNSSIYDWIFNVDWNKLFFDYLFSHGTIQRIIDLLFPLSPIHPVSDNAILLDGLHREYVNSGFVMGAVEDNLRGAGYDVSLLINEEVTEQALSEIDDTGYGVIFISGHGGAIPDQPGANNFNNFAVSLGRRFPDEQTARANVRWIGTDVIRMRDYSANEHFYCIYFTPLFVDTYCNDRPFPNSFMYWFSCGTATDVAGSERLFHSFYDKGAICGWVGMDDPNALMAANSDATNIFFRCASERGAYLIDSVKRARIPGFSGAGNQRLWPENASYNNICYIENEPPFIDLGIRHVERSGDNLIITIGNEGTESLEVGRRFTVGIKDSLNAEYESTVEVVTNIRLRPAWIITATIPMIDSQGTITVGIDISNDIPEDSISSNNTKDIPAWEL